MKMQLPELDDIIVTDCSTLLVIAVDKDEAIWTCVNKITRELGLYSFDENRNAVHLTIDYEKLDWEVEEGDVVLDFDNEC
jgi:hypothetical protein